MLCEFPDNNIKIKYIVKIGTQLNYLMDENIYEFNPKLDGKSLFTFIEGLSAKGYIGDTKENITKQMEKDYPRTQEFSFYFLKSFPKEGETYKFEEDNIKDFFWDEMKKTFYNNSSNLSFIQSWSKNVIICLLLAKDNLNLARYIFMQTYPYIAFFEEFIYRNVKDGSPYFSIFEFQKINKNKKLGLNIFINISYPFSLKLFKNNLINRYLLDNYVQDWEIKNEVNLGKILKNSKMESKRNMVKNKLRLLYFYSDYSQEEVKKYYAKYGLIFMHFSLFLPDLIYLNNNPQIYKIMNSSAEDPETFSNMKDGISVMNYFMSKSDSEIIRLREENVKLIGSYYNYIKSIISENPYYDQKTFDNVTKVILQSRGKTVNNKLIKNTYTDIPNINRMFEEIITSGITY